jgi:UDP-N-acetylglucosamine 4-epimerase
MSSLSPLTAGPELQAWLETQPALREGRWFVTGAAGFIGSHLVEALLRAGAEVVGLDNFLTGRREALAAAVEAAGPEAARRFTFIEGDIRDFATCERAMAGVRWVLHQAALGSVPRSIENPIASHEVNVSGHLHVMHAARLAGVERMVYASSSSVYGDDPTLPKLESQVGRVLSPYAATKRTNETYAGVFASVYGQRLTGLRYFNVFGPRQDPAGPYAAVIPRWLDLMADGRPCVLHGDGLTSRDFCFVSNVVAANLLAATAPGDRATHEVFNVACGEKTSLRDLYATLRDAALARGMSVPAEPQASPQRPGDIRHSLADIGVISAALGYRPLVLSREGLPRTAHWYFAVRERSG